MTIREAMRARHKFVRLPMWNPTAALELPAVDEYGYHGPWTTLHDGGSVTKILVHKIMPKDGWEPCEKPEVVGTATHTGTSHQAMDDGDDQRYEHHRRKAEDDHDDR